MLISVQTKKCTEKQANEFIRNLQSDNKFLQTKHYIRKGGVKIAKILAYAPNMFVQWLLEDNLLVLIKSDVNLYEVPQMYLEATNDAWLKDFILEQDYTKLEQKENLVREEHNEIKSFKLIKKAAHNGSDIKLNILAQLSTQDPDNIKIALIIEEKYTKHIWFIYGFKNGVCNCFANLNDNQFSEFGSVRFSDISSAFFLENGGDDNNFSIKKLNFDTHPTYQDIYKLCER